MQLAGVLLLDLCADQGAEVVELIVSQIKRKVPNASNASDGIEHDQAIS